MMAVGNLAVLYDVLAVRPRTIRDRSPYAVLQPSEREAFRFTYVKLMVSILCRYHVRMTYEHGKDDPFNVFHASLYTLVNAIVAYAEQDDAPGQESVTEPQSEEERDRRLQDAENVKHLHPETVHRGIKTLLEKFWPGRWDTLRAPQKDPESGEWAPRNAVNLEIDISHVIVEQRVELRERDQFDIAQFGVGGVKREADHDHEIDDRRPKKRRVR